MPNDDALRLAKNGLAIRIAQEQASTHADNVASGQSGLLRLGAPPIVAGRYLTSVLAKFMNDFPDCVVELRTGLVHELRSMVERGQIDLVIAPQNLAEHSEELEFLPLVNDRIGILSKVDHHLSKQKKITRNDLKNERWLAHSRGSLLWHQTETAMVALGLHQIRIACVTDSIRSALEIVAETELITTMPRLTTEPYLGDQLSFLPFEHPLFKRNLGAVYRANMPVSPAMSRFLKLLQRGSN